MGSKEGADVNGERDKGKEVKEKEKGEEIVHKEEKLRRFQNEGK